MFALRNLSCVLMLAAFAGPAYGQAALWNVETSTVQESGSSTDVRFRFLSAGSAIASQGAGAGSMLFEGERNGTQVSGLAWAFKAGCPAESYEATGSYAPDGKTLTLNGREPIKDASCHVVSFHDRTMVLTKQGAVATAPPQQPVTPPQQPAVPSPPAATPVTPASPTRSYWAHNGSTLYLSVNGTSRELYYDTPHPRMASVGVRNGTLLFQGAYANATKTYSGTAHIFSKQCGVLTYQVSGPVTNNFEKITLYGQRPVPDASCNIHYAPDTLEFDLCVKTLPPGAVARLCPL
jgi:hypothetical protein